MTESGAPHGVHRSFDQVLAPAGMRNAFHVRGGNHVHELVTLLIAAGLGAGCATDGYGTGTVYASASYSTPDLAYVGPGVSVIANYDVPIFYSNGSYWLYDDGYWYRSPRYTGGWSYVRRPPHAIASIRSPYVYRYYTPRNYRPRYRPVPSYRVERPTVRDHRARRYYYRRR